ncbi:TetR/AcrR family transcriptional regulator, partial [Pseudomonas syringae]|nr:TetR/AcrR family transcriptional regulator [Pseudomonas syringae]
MPAAQPRATPMTRAATPRKPQARSQAR